MATSIIKVNYEVDQTVGKTFTFDATSTAAVLNTQGNTTLFYVPFPFATKNTNYSVTMPTITITNVLSQTAQASIKSTHGVTFGIAGAHSSANGATVGTFTITFA